MENYNSWLYSEYSKAVHYLQINQDITHISLGGKNPKTNHKKNMVFTVKKKPALQWFSQHCFKQLCITLKTANVRDLVFPTFIHIKYAIQTLINFTTLAKNEVPNVLI